MSTTPDQRSQYEAAPRTPAGAGTEQASADGSRDVAATAQGGAGGARGAAGAPRGPASHLQDHAAETERQAAAAAEDPAGAERQAAIAAEDPAGAERDAAVVAAVASDTASVARDAANWAKAVSHLSVDEVPEGAVNLNVAGRRVVSPIQGFGKMWQKTYQIRLEGVAVTPEEVITTWKAHFGEFWPRKNWFYGSMAGIAPGDVALLDLRVAGGVHLRTGVLVLYADETSFTVMTPQGHQFAGFNTFSARRDGEAVLVEIQALIRGSDPIYEVSLAFGGHRLEDRFWEHTLRALAAHFGAEGTVEKRRVCVDRRRQWSKAGNVWQNAAARSVLYSLAAPGRWLAGPLRRRP